MIPVDAETAQIYESATEEERRRIQLMLRLQLHSWIAGAQRSLNEIMDEIGTKAEQRGLTPELLAEILHDEGLSS